MAGGCRYLGLDIHKNHVMVAATDAQQRVILQPRKISIRCFPEWVADHLVETDVVALEATTSAWHLVDLLKPLVHEVQVANTYQTRDLRCTTLARTKAMPNPLPISSSSGWINIPSNITPTHRRTFLRTGAEPGVRPL